MRQTPRPVLLGKFIAAFPAVKRELSRWKSLAQTIPEPLRTQALLSIEHKAFHCLGGSVYAQYPGVHGQTMLSFVVALQTISDYLDNLCDRLGVCDPPLSSSSTRASGMPSTHMHPLTTITLCTHIVKRPICLVWYSSAEDLTGDSLLPPELSLYRAPGRVLL